MSVFRIRVLHIISFFLIIIIITSSTTTALSHLHSTCTHSMLSAWLVRTFLSVWPHDTHVHVEVRMAASTTWPHPRPVGTTPPVALTTAMSALGEGKTHLLVLVAVPCPGLRVGCVRVAWDGVQ